MFVTCRFRKYIHVLEFSLFRTVCSSCHCFCTKFNSHGKRSWYYSSKLKKKCYSKFFVQDSFEVSLAIFSVNAVDGNRSSNEQYYTKPWMVVPIYGNKIRVCHNSLSLCLTQFSQQADNGMHMHCYLRVQLQHLYCCYCHLTPNFCIIHVHYAV